MTDIAQLKGNDGVGFYVRTHVNGIVGLDDYLIGKLPTFVIADELNDGLMSKEMYAKLLLLQVYEPATELKDGLMTSLDRIQMNKLNAESLEINSPNGTAFLITVSNDGKLLVNKKEITNNGNF